MASAFALCIRYALCLPPSFVDLILIFRLSILQRVPILIPPFLPIHNYSISAGLAEIRVRVLRVKIMAKLRPRIRRIDSTHGCVTTYRVTERSRGNLWPIFSITGQSATQFLIDWGMIYIPRKNMYLRGSRNAMHTKPFVATGKDTLRADAQLTCKSHRHTDH